MLHRLRRDQQVAVTLGAVTLGVAALVWLMGLDFLWEARPVLAGVWGWHWSPGAARFGTLALIASSLVAASGALLIALPLGLGLALYLTEFAGPGTTAWLQRTLQVLAGLPSVVIGTVGWIYLVTWAQAWGDGAQLFVTFALLGLLIIPPIATLGAEALTALPLGYREGAVALGATRWQAVRRLLLPAAQAGLVQAALLAYGRALGETMIVLMTTKRAPLDLLEGFTFIRPATVTIALETAASSGDHRAALFGAGAVLLALTLLIGALARRVGRR